MDWHDHYEAAVRAMARVEDVTVTADEPDWLAAVRWLDKVRVHFGEVAVHCAQEAYRAGATKKQIAQALDMPPSALRGLQK